MVAGVNLVACVQCVVEICFGDFLLFDVAQGFCEHEVGVLQIDLGGFLRELLAFGVEQVQ